MINKAQEKSVVINRKNVSIKGILTVNNKQIFFCQRASGDNGLFITQFPKVLQ